MTLGRRLATVLAASASALAAAGAADGDATSRIAVSVDPAAIATQLGRTVVVHTTVSNDAAEATGPLVAHLNVLSLREGVEVDPEDWSTHRTRYLGTISAGGSRTITWKVHAITKGRIALYVAVLPQRRPNGPPTTGRAVQLVVAGRDTLNSGGILPLALGIPSFLALMTAGVRLTRRRR